MLKKEFVIGLYRTGAIKFGKFVLKSGLESPFYIDLRDVVSDNKMLDMITQLIVEKIGNLKYDVITGIPYTALPFATLVAQKINKPMIFFRKEKKSYGTGKDIIGKFNKNDVCLVIDDLITTGESKIETAKKLSDDGMVVKDFVVLIDRSKNAKEEMKKYGYNLISVITLDEILEILQNEHLIDEKKIQEIKDFVNNPVSVKSAIKENRLTKLLKEKIIAKKSNLVLSLDVDNKKDFFDILKQTAKSIVLLKTHIDIISDFDENFIPELLTYAEKYNFMIFEDRKFADIGNTVRLQYHKGIYQISSWSDFVTAHLVAGEGTLLGLFDNFDKGAAFVLGRMSSKDNLIDDNYTRKTIEIAKKHSNMVSGFIGHGKDKYDLQSYKRKLPSGMLLLVPGVKLQKGYDNLGQQYLSVEDAMLGGADCIIVGRGIIKSENISETAELYRKTAWEIYKNKLGG